jgi:hypothetical protein
LIRDGDRPSTAPDVRTAPLHRVVGRLALGEHMVDRARITRGQATVSWLIEKLEKRSSVPDYSPSGSIVTLGDFRE